MKDLSKLTEAAPEAPPLKPWQKAIVNRKAPRTFEERMVRRVAGMNILQLRNAIKRLPKHFRGFLIRAGSVTVPHLQQRFLAQAEACKIAFTIALQEVAARTPSNEQGS